MMLKLSAVSLVVCLATGANFIGAIPNSDHTMEICVEGERRETENPNTNDRLLEICNNNEWEPTHCLVGEEEIEVGEFLIVGCDIFNCQPMDKLARLHVQIYAACGEEAAKIEHCFIGGVGKVGVGERVRNDGVVLECQETGLYTVSACVLENGVELAVGDHVDMGNHHWECRAVRGGSGAELSSSPLMHGEEECEEGDTHQHDHQLRGGFTHTCLNHHGKNSWQVTHCQLRSGETIPVGQSLEKDIVTFTCLLLKGGKVRIVVKPTMKPSEKHNIAEKTIIPTPNNWISALTARRTHVKSVVGEEVNEDDTALPITVEETSCSDPCRLNGYKMCPGEDTLVKKMEAGDSRLRCKSGGVMEQYCRIIDLGSEESFELTLGSYTTLDGYILSCARLGRDRMATPSNDVVDLPPRRMRLRRFNYRFVPSEQLSIANRRSRHH